MAEKYITGEQRAGRQKVVDMFTELYRLTDMVVIDAGRFGFVCLQWFSEGEDFGPTMALLDSRELFEGLWRIWYEHEVLTSVLETSLAELDYDEIFQTLSRNRQKEITEKKKYFLARCKDVFSQLTNMFPSLGVTLPLKTSYNDADESVFEKDKSGIYRE